MNITKQYRESVACADLYLETQDIPNDTKNVISFLNNQLKESIVYLEGLTNAFTKAISERELLKIEREILISKTKGV